MQKLNDLSRSPSPIDPDGTLIAVIELSLSSWLVAGMNAVQVLTFHLKAWSRFAPPTRRMPLGQSQGIPRADPGGRVIPRF